MRCPTTAILASLLFTLPACSSKDSDTSGNDGDTADGQTDDHDDSGTDGTGGEGTGDSATGDGGTGTGEDSGLKVHEFRVDYDVPQQETYYACFSITIPTDQLVHLVGFKPAVNSAMVHHYVLAQAADSPEVEPGTSCYDWPGQTIWGWAPGIDEWTLPDNVGYPAGKDGKVHLILQIHYTNPLTEQEHDTSGVDIMYTENLREHDAGVLTIGDIIGISIPPGESNYEHVANCSSAQTESVLPEPINVFATWLHAHEIGKTIWTDHIRDGEVIGELGRDEPFRFEKQHFRPVDAVIKPGDELQTHCFYDSTEREDTTPGGVATDEEMCVNFVFYYPAGAAQTCGAL